jgi:hypothetical protein
MAELTKVFLFANGVFNVVDIDEDTTQKAENDAPIRVCSPKEEIKLEIMAANPGVYKFYIDSSSEADVELFDANFKAAE